MHCNSVLTNDEISRYSRQIRLAEVGKEGQEKIKGASVLVIGAGALGCPVLQYLTVAGVGILGLDGVLSGKLFMIDTLNFNTFISSFDRNLDLPAITELGEYEDSTLCDSKSVKEITAKELRKMYLKDSGIIVIDLRSREDDDDTGFKTIAIPHFDVSRYLKLISGTETVVFYCRSG
ncbi:MAG: ThiF family adenylyltransferase, partial [Bacteroidales bacterium]|nr:ThiF family adenylyltransferase [Bacteroidales bacterium]